MGRLIASSRCPICGMDTPHAHTKLSLAAKYREELLRARFEKNLLGWFARYKDVVPGSHGMGIHMTRKAANGSLETYSWWPVEMLWEFFRYGVSLFEPPLPNGHVADVNEAFEIKKYPFGKGLPHV